MTFLDEDLKVLTEAHQNIKPDGKFIERSEEAEFESMTTLDVNAVVQFHRSAWIGLIVVSNFDQRYPNLLLQIHDSQQNRVYSHEPRDGLFSWSLIPSVGQPGPSAPSRVITIRGILRDANRALNPLGSNAPGSDLQTGSVLFYHPDARFPRPPSGNIPSPVAGVRIIQVLPSL